MKDNIKAILDNFDFEHVHRVMKAVNWKWYGESVPTEAALRKAAQQYLEQADGAEVGYITGSGGLEVEKTSDDGLVLRFVVEDVNEGDVCQLKNEDGEPEPEPHVAPDTRTLASLVSERESLIEQMAVLDFGSIGEEYDALTARQQTAYSEHRKAVLQHLEAVVRRIGYTLSKEALK